MFNAENVIASIRDRGPYLTSLQKRVQRYVCHLAHCILVNADAVKDYGAEIVIVATGGYWATDGLQGCSHAPIEGCR